MDFVADAADVVVGDVVVTSGIDGIYPKGFVIGRVEAVEKSGGAYHRIVVQAGGRLFGSGGRARGRHADARARTCAGGFGVKAARIILAVAVALALQTTLARFVVREAVAIDLVLVVVVYVALTSGSATGLLTGAFAGLIQDALSSGVIGIGGLAKTIVGFLAGIIGTQFIVSQPLPRFLVFFGAAVLHAAVFMGLYVLLDLRHFGTSMTVVAGQAAGNAVVGVLVFQVVEFLPGAVERRRASRTRLRR